MGVWETIVDWLPLEALLSLLLTGLIYAGLAAVFPLRRPVGGVEADRAAEREAYLSWYRRMVALTLVALVPWVYGCHRLLLFVARQWNTGPGDLHVVLPGGLYWISVAFFLGVLTLGGLADLVLKRAVSKARYEALERVTAQEVGEVAGYDVSGAAPCLLTVLAAVLVPLLLLGCDWSARFTAAGIVIDDLLSLDGRTYSYREVRRVEKVWPGPLPEGGEATECQYRIVFRDGTVWRTPDLLVLGFRPGDGEACAFAAKQAGIPLATVNGPPR